LFIGIPVHRVPQVVTQSGLAVDGWVPVNPSNLTTRFPGVYALGDVASANCPKAGVWAETAARVVSDDIAARIRDDDPPSAFQGDGTCYIEFGAGMVARIEANFLGGPTPTARVYIPSGELAAEKRAYEAARRRTWFGRQPSGTTGEPRSTELAVNLARSGQHASRREIGPDGRS
jgi:sulfide:quinone oxidoreductase